MPEPRGRRNAQGPPPPSKESVVELGSGESSQKEDLHSPRRREGSPYFKKFRLSGSCHGRLSWLSLLRFQRRGSSLKYSRQDQTRTHNNKPSVDFVDTAAVHYAATATPVTFPLSSTGSPFVAMFAAAMFAAIFAAIDVPIGIGAALLADRPGQYTSKCSKVPGCIEGS